MNLRLIQSSLCRELVVSLTTRRAVACNIFSAPRTDMMITFSRLFRAHNSTCMSEKGLFLSVYVDDIKRAGKKQNIDPMWKVLMKDVD